eukprot:gene30316-39542_t
MISCFISDSIQREHNAYPILSEALRFIDLAQNSLCHQDHKTNSSIQYSVVTIGIGGGFAAQFQLAASEWMRAFAALNFSVPVLIRGKLWGYSEGLECKHVQQEWTCYFQPMTRCDEFLISSGTRIPYGSLQYDDEKNIPDPFKQKGLAFWWGAVQHKMFRFQPFVDMYVMDEAKRMNRGLGFPFGLQVAGLHVRHGDKHTDGFREHSFVEELASIRKSPDCKMQNAMGDCFARVNLTAPSTTTVSSKLSGESTGVLRILSKLSRRHAILLEPLQIEGFNTTNVMNVLAMSLPQGKESAAAKEKSGHASTRVGNISQQLGFVDPKQLMHEIKSSSANGSQSVLSVMVAKLWLTPLQIFVTAVRLGYLADDSGISQQTASTGMLKTLLAHPELGYNASLEIISDIFFLSQCSTLLGIAGSQVFRMSVALSNASDILTYAVAVDTDQLNKVRHMSMKYHIPFPEEFNKR